MALAASVRKPILLHGPTHLAHVHHTHPATKILLADADAFPRTMTEKLLAYALGRRLGYYDRPAVREIVRTAAADDYRWSSLILGIVKSPTFRSRSVAGSATN